MYWVIGIKSNSMPFCYIAASSAYYPPEIDDIYTDLESYADILNTSPHDVSSAPYYFNNFKMIPTLIIILRLARLHS